MGRGLGAEVGEFIGAFVHAVSSVGSHVFEEDVDAAGSEGCIDDCRLQGAVIELYLASFARNPPRRGCVQRALARAQV